MAVVKNLMVRAGADFSGMRKEMQKAHQDLIGFKTKMSGVLKAIGTAVAAIGIGTMIKDATKTAMDVEASMQQINRTMGSSAQSFTDWANKSAIAFNMGKADAIKFGAVYSNLISGFTQDTATTMKRTEDLLKAAAVVASSTGRSMTDVMERIRSGMLGNTEAIEDLGIYANVAMLESTNAFNKFANGKSWQQLDFQTQQQIRLFAILEQATQKYGAAVADNTNSRQQQFIAQLKNAQLSLGQFVLPIYNAILPALTAMASALANVMSFLAQFSQALFGKAEVSTKATDQQAAAVSGLGDAYTDAGKAAKGAVAGFDEVNTLADSAGSAGSAGAGSAAPSINPGQVSGFAKATEEISQRAREMAEKVKTAFREMSNFIAEHKDIILAALVGLAAGFAAFWIATKWGAMITALRTFFVWVGDVLVAALAAVSWPILAIAAAIAVLTGAFVYFYRTNDNFRGFVDGILKAIGDAAVWLWQNVMVPFGKFMADVFVAAWQAITVAAKWFWENVMIPLGDFLLWFWQHVVVPLSGVLEDALGIAFMTVADIAKSFWENVLIPLAGFFADTFGPAVEALSAVFTFLWENVLQPLGIFLGNTLKPIFITLTNVIVFLWQEVLKPLVEFVGGALFTTFDTVFQAIGGIIDGMKTSFIGLMHFITGVFTGDWEKAWNGVRDVFKGVFESLYAIVKAPLNLIIDAVNTLINGINSIKIDVPEWVKSITGFSSFGFHIPNIPHLAKGGITNGPMMAMIGDNPGGEEVVSPLAGLLDMIQSAVGTAVMAAAQFSNSRQGDIIVNIEGVQLARVLGPYAQKENSRVGSSMITTSGAAAIITT